MNVRPECQTCVYFDRLSHPGDDHGFCRRYAPRAATIGGKGTPLTLWPIVYAEAWCGEYLERE